jgi:hypothetical protein
MERQLASAKMHQAIRRVIDYAKAAKILHGEALEVREQVYNTIPAAEHRIGEELRKSEVNKGGRPTKKPSFNERGFFTANSLRTGLQPRLRPRQKNVASNERVLSDIFGGCAGCTRRFAASLRIFLELSNDA